MIHNIILWICGLASILGIVLYILDKTTNKEFSLKLILGLIIGGILVAIILAITDPNNKDKSDKKPTTNNSTINIKENTNSPVANNVESQTNNYYQTAQEKYKIEYTSNLELIKGGDCCLMIKADLRNQSDLSGTLPNIEIQIYGLKMDGNLIELTNYKEVNKWDECRGHTFYKIFTENKIPFSGILCSNSKFAENILYPKDYLSLFSQTKKIPNLKNIKYIIGHLQTKIKEGAPQRNFFLFKYGEENKLKLIMKVEDADLPKLVEKYLTSIAN